MLQASSRANPSSLGVRRRPSGPQAAIRGGDKVDEHVSTYWSPDTSFSAARALGIDLQLSGHTHGHQVFPLGFVTRLIYGPAAWGLHTEDGFALFTTTGTGTWGPPMRTGDRSEIAVITLR